jgi:hypothetical protein
VTARANDSTPDVLSLVNDVLSQIGDRAQRVTSEIAGTGWRIEVTRRGKYWQSRRGSGKHKESRYGGKFSMLSAERQAAYYVNRENYHRRRAADQNGDRGASVTQSAKDRRDGPDREPA